MAEIRRIAVTSGSGSGPEGGNSAYLLPARGVLVDPGPPGDDPWRRLCDGIEDARLSLTDIDHVLVTHWHADHTGNAPRLASAADATLWLHERDAPLLGDYANERERRVTRDAETLRQWGVPDDRIDELVAFDSPTPVPDSTPVESLADGDTVAGVEVLHTPGHTAGHAAFVLDEDESEGDVAGFVGDAVLRTVTPNVGGGDTRQTAPLSAYRETLARLSERVDMAHPGHGTAFDVSERTAEIRAHHRERSVHTLDALSSLAETDSGVTPWAVATDLFGEMADYHVKFGAGEAFAHLQHLTELGLAVLISDDCENGHDDVHRYVPTERRGDVSTTDLVRTTWSE
ncbi:MBL fold metallo-hydrolase [Haloarchaeobius sp. DFWS5]|uniref:MBL fold metallo-hydrolase n=1 Tax=Haloarchaeobius sp. DFWS5 TaxID=3446114 RepID=UPI003EBB499D